MALLFAFFFLAASGVLATNSSVSKFCRDRNGLLTLDQFSLTSCADCYGYLYPVKDLRAFHGYLVNINSSKGTEFYEANIRNGSARDSICATLSADECHRWQQCCHAAEECCQRTTYKSHAYESQHFVTSCPRTWDGFGCFDDTPVSSIVTLNCPLFIPHAIPSMYAYKQCTENATWYEDPEFGFEWTDYKACLDTRHSKLHLTISVACNVASLLALIPAFFICIAFKALRCQLRVRLHINLYLSFILFSLCNIMWDVFVLWDRLKSQWPSESIISKNYLPCRLLYMVARYLRVTNYMWMFCEAYFLHRLIVKAFEPPKSIYIFYVIGWGVPIIPVTIYAIMKAIRQYDSCWLVDMGAMEWFIYVPNLLSLSVNLIFLIHILRILLTQLQSHPNEPSSYRRAIKAALILVPLFGIQSLMIIYQPHHDNPARNFYDIAAVVIINSQGLLVAITLCFFNNEVISIVKKSYTSQCCRTKIYREDRRKSTTVVTELECMRYHYFRGSNERFDSRRGSYTPVGESRRGSCVPMLDSRRSSYVARINNWNECGL